MKKTTTITPEQEAVLRELSLEQIWAFLKKYDFLGSSFLSHLDDFYSSDADILERTIEPNIVGEFYELGLHFDRTGTDSYIHNEKDQIFTSASMTLDNIDTVMVVTFRYELSVEDIDEHVKCLEDWSRHNGLRGYTKKKHLGAVTGTDFGEKEKTYAFKNGFYVIEVFDDTITITAPSGEYRPRVWWAGKVME